MTMSIIRRVKSFSVKKYSSSDELKRDVSMRSNPRNRKKTVQRERSVSLECIPLHIELEKSDLFHRQRMKVQKEEEEDGKMRGTVPKRVPSRPRLTKRKSVSFDEVHFSRCIEEMEENDVRFRRQRDGRGPRQLNKSRYNTVDVVKSISNVAMYPRDFEKPGQKFQKNPIQIVRLERHDFESDFQPPRPHQTNLVKSKSDWYINLMPDDRSGASYHNELIICSFQLRQTKRKEGDDYQFGRGCGQSATKKSHNVVVVLKDKANSLRRNGQKMWNRCVVEWLRDLRHEIEAYEDFLCEMPTDPDGELYENLWECTSSDETSGNLTVKFGQVCRVSTSFSEKYENLQIVPVVYECADADDVPEDVHMWKTRLRHTYCAEEECFLETEDLIANFETNEQKGSHDIVDKPANFPVLEEEVQIRPNRNRAEVRPSTYAPTLTRKKDDFVDAKGAKGVKNIGPWSQLRKLLKKRSSRDILESKGIYRNEPIFGNTLEELCNDEHPVPEVVTRIVKLIEQDENITSLGLYRASANLAVVQNIRFEINCKKWEILDKHRTDVDVLAGTLKLFFRELKEPLISSDIYQKLHNVIINRDTGTEINEVIDLLPPPNRSTLRYIIGHLLRVCEHKRENKMDLHNIAICWAPSLITLPENCTDLVTQTTEFTTITEDLLIYYSTRTDTLDGPEKPRDFVYDVLRKLTGIIETYINVEGIYRRSGSNAKIDKLMKILERKKLEEIDEKSNVHDLCCVLKKYLASVRKSIVPDDFFHAYCEICDKVDDGTLREEVHRMLSILPRRPVIQLLFEHLQKVVHNERRNKMSLHVLSNIWMTTLLTDFDVHNHKKKMPKYANLFLILMNLNDHALPDLVADPKMRIYSTYENVPDDIQNDIDADTGGERELTKL